MFKNYLKIALRNLWKNKVFSAINIIGLSAGLAVCLLIVTDIHLHSNKSYEFEANGNIAYVYIFSVIAIFILLIAFVTVSFQAIKAALSNPVTSLRSE